MPTDPEEVERLRKVVAHVHHNLLTLIDARPKQPGFIPGSALPALYEQTFNAPLNPAALTGQSDLKAMLNRRNIFPNIGVRGSDKKGGWLIYRVAKSSANKTTADASVECPPELQRVQENILEVLREAPHNSLDAGTLLNKYGEKCRARFNFRDFGFPTLRALLEQCPKLAVVMRGSSDKPNSGKDKMHVAIRRGTDPESQTGKRTRDEKPTAAVAPSASSSLNAEPPPLLPVAVAPAAGEGNEDADEKAARKAAKRAKRLAEAGLTEEEAAAASAEAKARRKEKKAAGKAKKREFLAAKQGGR